MIYIDPKFGRSFIDADGQQVHEMPEEAFDAFVDVLKANAFDAGYEAGKADGRKAAKQPARQSGRKQRQALVAGLALLAGAIGMHIFDTMDKDQATAAARTQALQDNQPMIREAGKAEGHADGLKEGRAQGWQKGYTQGASKMEDALKSRALNLIAQANRQAEQERQRTEDIRLRALRIITSQQRLLQAQRPCYSVSRVDIDLFGAAMNVGTRKQGLCPH